MSVIIEYKLFFLLFHPNQVNKSTKMPEVTESETNREYNKSTGFEDGKYEY